MLNKIINLFTKSVWPQTFKWSFEFILIDLKYYLRGYLNFTQKFKFCHYLSCPSKPVWLSSMEHNIHIYFFFSVFVWFCPYNESQWGSKLMCWSHWPSLNIQNQFFRISSLCYTENKIGIRMSKLWHLFNLPFKRQMIFLFLKIHINSLMFPSCFTNSPDAYNINISYSFKWNAEEMLISNTYRSLWVETVFVLIAKVRGQWSGQ